MLENNEHDGIDPKTKWLIFLLLPPMKNNEKSFKVKIDESLNGKNSSVVMQKVALFKILFMMVMRVMTIL